MINARAFLSAIVSPLALVLLLATGCAKPDAAPAGGMCAADQATCDQGCFDLFTSPQHCGSCTNSCAAGQSCVNGACGCAAGYELCSGTCVALASSHDHCGSCTTVCTTAQVCSNGACSSAGCPSSTMNCGGSCIPTMTDSQNCGSCNIRCRVDQVCSNGVCGCSPGQVLCNGSCASSCVNPGTGGTSGQGGATGAGGRGGAGGGAQGGAPGQGGNTGAGGFTGANPPGWWTAGSWHGCTWTAKDTVANSTTSNTPMDFLTRTTAPYCVSGIVNPTYESVAILGFNLNETPTSLQTQCAYKAPDPTRVGPAGVTLTGDGIAISFSRTTGSNLRIQIQGPNGGMAGPTGENNRWCYTITEVQGPVFAPFSKFNTHCWNPTAAPAGMPYRNEPISAISFLVPGLPVPSPFSYCIGGFATGTSASAAPAYTPSPANPVVSGVIGGPGPGRDLDFQRVKVNPAGSTKQYIIQNNNWGTPEGTDQTIDYQGNSFTVRNTSGNVTGAGVPASFPSIYVGGNGDTQSLNDPPKGVFSTHPGDNLPRQISQIGTANTTFTWSGGTGNRDFNATYDIWVASGAPTSMYEDAVSGFVMVWLYKPATRIPISMTGSSVGTASIGGTTYDVWVGPRGTGTNPNRPVVSYVVANSTAAPVMSKTFDLKLILADAASRGIPSNWYVTDIFGGFEIWTGSTAAGLRMVNFTVDVQ